MMRSLSGPRRFLDFAYPCALDQYVAGKISREDYEAIVVVHATGREPEMSLLKRCFPNAARHIKTWSSEEVADYWHNRHGHSGDCAVKKAIVDHLMHGGAIVYLVGNEIPLSNINRLGLRRGDKVYIHRGAVVEKIAGRRTN